MSNITQNFWQTFEPIKVIGKRRGYFLLTDLDDTANPDWLGASYAVLQYNYVATGNFTMDELPDLSQLTDQGWVVCIRYRVGGVVTRYKLNEVTTSDALMDSVYFPLYNGEVILKNFTVEIWMATAETTDLAPWTPIQFNMSILQAKQTLTDDDTFEDCVETLCTTLQSQNNLNLDLLFASCATGVTN